MLPFVTEHPVPISAATIPSRRSSVASNLGGAAGGGWGGSHHHHHVGSQPLIESRKQHHHQPHPTHNNSFERGTPRKMLTLIDMVLLLDFQQFYC